METSYKRLLTNNEAWAKAKVSLDPQYFKRQAKGQNPEFLWIGCSDSRVPASEITDTDPGELFEHRNIANMVVLTDLNFLSVLQYAVEVLEVKHIIVCGHYGCGGVAAAMSNKSAPINYWLNNIKEVYAKYAEELSAISDQSRRAKRLVELNVVEQAKNLAKTAALQQAWQKRELFIHAWVYELENGRIKDLGAIIQDTDGLEPIFRYEDYNEVDRKLGSS